MDLSLTLLLPIHSLYHIFLVRPVLISRLISNVYNKERGTSRVLNPFELQGFLERTMGYVSVERQRLNPFVLQGFLEQEKTREIRGKGVSIPLYFRVS